jgi:sugar lactone lactonase YvrE
VAFDASGNLYVANSFSGSIAKITPAGAVSMFVSGGLGEPTELAFDSAGNLYVADSVRNGIFDGIYKVTPAGVVSTVVNGGLPASGLACDAAGNLYVSNQFQDTISKVTPAGVVSTFVNTGLDTPRGIAFDSNGNLYVANEDNDTISRVTKSGAASTFANSGLDHPIGLAMDAFNNLYVTGFSPALAVITRAETVSTVVEFDLFPGDIACDAAGNVYLADPLQNVIFKVTVSSSSVVAAARVARNVAAGQENKAIPGFSVGLTPAGTSATHDHGHYSAPVKSLGEESKSHAAYATLVAGQGTIASESQTALARAIDQILGKGLLLTRLKVQLSAG